MKTTAMLRRKSRKEDILDFLQKLNHEIKTFIRLLRRLPRRPQREKIGATCVLGLNDRGAGRLRAAQKETALPITARIIDAGFRPAPCATVRFRGNSQGNIGAALNVMCFT